jgi:hypothetical protein
LTSYRNGGSGGKADNEALVIYVDGADGGQGSDALKTSTTDLLAPAMGMEAKNIWTSAEAFLVKRSA